MRSRHLTLLWALSLAGTCHFNVAQASRGAEYWRNKTIYQVFTDRFAKGFDGDAVKPCRNFARYCGGNLKGVEDFAEYIKGMGFDAVWISPVSSQTQGADWLNIDGFHGYWPENMYEMNEKFGSERDMQAMVDTLHAAGISVMLDTVPNHIGYKPPEHTYPFNKGEYFHGCKRCGLGCKYDRSNEESVTTCRLSNLRDLDHSQDFVADELITWHEYVASKYGLDGFRVDAAKHIDPSFLQALYQNTTLFTIGEFASPKVSYISARLSAGALASSLNFFLQNVIKNVFWEGKDMSLLSELVAMFKQLLPKHVDVLRNFADSHDTERFLCMQPDIPMFKNALAAVFLLPGIPVLYYGSEQAMIGARDALWNFEYATDSELYIYIKMLAHYRKQYQLWDQELQEVTALTGRYLQDNVYGFTHGQMLVILTNAKSSKGWTPVQTSVILPSQMYSLTLTNILDPSDTISVSSAGQAVILKRKDGNPQIYVPVAADPTSFGVPRGPAYVRTAEHMPMSRVLFGVFCGLALFCAILMRITLDGGWGTLVRMWQLRRNDRVRFTEEGAPVATELPPQSANPFLTIKGMGAGSPRLNQVAPDAEAPAVSKTTAPAALHGSLRAAGDRPSRLSIPSGAAKDTRISYDGGGSLRGHRPGSAAAYARRPPAKLPSRREVMAMASAGVRPKRESHPGEPAASPDGTRQRHPLPQIDESSKQPSMERTPHAHPATPADVHDSAQHLPGAVFAAHHGAAGHREASSEHGRQQQQQPVAESLLEDPEQQWKAGGTVPIPVLPADDLLSAEHSHHSLSSALEKKDSTGGVTAHILGGGASRSVTMSSGVRGSACDLSQMAASQRKPSMVAVWSKPGESFVGNKSRRKSMHAAAMAAAATGGSSTALAQMGEVMMSAHASGSATPQRAPRKSLDPIASTFSKLTDNLASLLKRQPDEGYNQAVAAAKMCLLREQVFHVAMEYTIPHLNMDSQFVYGGLGKVVDIFLRCWPGPMSLICPLYAEAYVDDEAPEPTFACEDGPDLSFTVVVDRQLVGVDVYKLEVPDSGSCSGAHPYAGARTFYLIQSDIFRHRMRGSSWRCF